MLVANETRSMVKFRYGLIKSLIKNNYEVYVISPYDDYVKEIENIGCKYIDIKVDNKGSNPFKDIKLTYDLYKIYNLVKPELIIHYTIKPNIYGSLSCLLSNIKCMSVIPGLGYAFINNNLISKIVKFLYKITLKIPTKVWFINEDDKELFLKLRLIDEIKVDVVNGEGINTDHFNFIERSSGDNKIKFLLIARILKDKGILEYVEASRILLRKYNNIEFQLLGPIYILNPSSISEQDVEKWHKDEIINYLGETNDVRSYIANSDCIVLPSYREGKGMTLVEAASMSKPIIATNVPGCRDVIDEGENGYLCEVKNSKSLANVMEKMLKLTKEERKEMGEKGRQKVKNELDENIVISKYLETIQDILK